MFTKRYYSLFPAVILILYYISASAIPIKSGYKFIRTDRFSGVRDNLDSDLLKNAVQDFMQKADSGKYAQVIPYYDSNFVSIRVVDSGPFIKMDYNQMVSFWKMQATRQAVANSFKQLAMTTQSTTIHFIEILGDTGYVLLTRVKDLGSGPEPMFYNLIWILKKSKWYLFREIVHQRTMPTLH